MGKTIIINIEYLADILLKMSQPNKPFPTKQVAACVAKHDENWDFKH